MADWKVEKWVTLTVVLKVDQTVVRLAFPMVDSLVGKSEFL